MAHVLEGSVRALGDRIRVTAQLIRADDGFHVWSENYDRDTADMIAIQEDLARSIADVLETTMDPDALAEMASVGTESVAAYQAYLQGVALSTGARPPTNGPTGKRSAMPTRSSSRRAHWIRALRRRISGRPEFWSTQLAPTRVNSGLTDLSPARTTG